MFLFLRYFYQTLDVYTHSTSLLVPRTHLVDQEARQVGEVSPEVRTHGLDGVPVRVAAACRPRAVLEEPHHVLVQDLRLRRQWVPEVTP